MATDASHDDTHGIPRVRFGAIRWLDRPLRTAVEETVSEHTGRARGMKSLRDLSEFACHRCAIVSDGSLAVFFKYSEAPGSWALVLPLYRHGIRMIWMR